jgi:hypothetical protein
LNIGAAAAERMAPVVVPPVMCDERLARAGACAVDDVENARGQPGFDAQFAEHVRGQRRHLAGLRDSGVARRERGTDLPREEIQGQIPRADEARDATW